MADDRTKPPASLPADADDLELELARAWLAEPVDDEDGPSELVDARILRAARGAMAGGPAAAPRRADPSAPGAGRRWGQWSAAAGLLCTVGIGLLLWRAAPTGPAPLPEAEPASAVPRAIAPIADAAREAPAPERRSAEEIAVRALRQARPATESPAPAPPLAEPASDTRNSATPADGATPIAELAAGKRAEAARELPALTGRLQREGTRWFLEPEDVTAADLDEAASALADRLTKLDGSSAEDVGTASEAPASAARGETTAPRLELGLDDLAPAARDALRDGARVRIRYRIEGSVARVIGIERLPE